MNIDRPRPFSLVSPKSLRNVLAAALLLTLFACGGSGGDGGTDPTPTFTLQPHSASVSEGGSASFTSSAVGGTVTYQWYKDGNPVGSSTSSSISFPSASSGNIGSYYVIATNASGGSASNVVTLTVTGNGGGDVTVK